MGTRTVLACLGLPLVAGAFALSSLGVAAAVVALPSPGPTSGADGTGLTGAGSSSGAGAGGSSGGRAGAPGSVRLPPASMVGLYSTAAAGTCPGLPWSVLAAVGTVESDNGESSSPGVHSGANEAGAEGPMQFEPATFAAYDSPVPLGGATPASPYDPVDAVWAAARLLCADGAGEGRLGAAVFAYNHSGAYVSEVLTLAAEYATWSP